ncbi:hypothetical protein [Moraxella bovis]|uniref:Uncharacterized protein n=1 Tax=Moraxella bovis TaxID=476 RepID=A0A378PWY8_MORBO|nr:hypothetical protein [Moraxella bovis]UZA15904.1 hypothetical protein LP109_09565 [Moraxella bovis]STY93002.1 Uncharacterised protein [Moraxella bovis]
MVIHFVEASKPLLQKESTYIFSKYFDAYADMLQSVEFCYKQNNDTYYFICATYYIELLLNGLAEISPINPCQLLSDYLDNCRDLDFENPEKSIIDDKDKFMQNIQLFLENEKIYQDFWNKDDLMAVCNDLIEFVQLSKNYTLIVQYG